MTDKTQEDTSLIALVATMKMLWSFLLKKWTIIVVFGISGAVLGLLLSFVIKPRYTANVSFALVEKSSPSGLVSLASTFGLGGLMSGGDAFSGDNLLEIIKSRYAFERTLLTPVVIEGERKTLADFYIRIEKYDRKWSKSKKADIQNLNFKVGQDRSTFTRAQDSVLNEFYKKLVKSNSFSISRKDKKSNIVFMNFTTHNEQFSKLFSEVLIDNTYEFYKETKTGQSAANINVIEQVADSIRILYETALYNSAGFSQTNINQAAQFAVVPKIKEEYNAQLYGTVYAEVLKNLETLKLEKARETPLIQLIDKPLLPLKKTKLGKLKGIVFGGLAGGMIIVVYLLLVFYFKHNTSTSFFDEDVDRERD